MFEELSPVRFDGEICYAIGPHNGPFIISHLTLYFSDRASQGNIENDTSREFGPKILCTWEDEKVLGSRSPWPNVFDLVNISDFCNEIR